MGKKTEVGSGMRSPTMPKEQFERHYSKLDGVDTKYASEFNAAEEYHAANEGLRNYVRKHAMKNS